MYRFRRGGRARCEVQQRLPHFTDKRSRDPGHPKRDDSIGDTPIAPKARRSLHAPTASAQDEASQIDACDGQNDHAPEQTQTAACTKLQQRPPPSNRRLRPSDRARTIDVDARRTPLDPPGKPAASPNPVGRAAGGAAAQSHSSRAIVPPSPGRTSASATFRSSGRVGPAAF